MSKFKVGDKVRIGRKDPNRLSDFESDMLQDVAEGDITRKAWAAMMDAMEQGAIWRVVIVEASSFDYGPTYEIAKGKLKFPAQLEEKDLEPA
jgi:hypothetical protein